jgi:serine/threonine protein kinase
LHPVEDSLSPGPASRAGETCPLPDSVLGLLQLIRRSRLLHTAQLNEIKARWLPELADAQGLAERLVRRGWLTRYQVELLLEGRDQELRLGPYHVLSLLGEGALGQVFRARHAERRCIVALKVLRPELRDDPEVLQQFWQERMVLARLTHPAFVRALEPDPDGTQYYFAMEYVDGIDLAKLLERAGTLPAAQACDYVRQAAVGLQYAYENGLVHRDVKPANLLVSFATGRVCILDIGSARLEWPADGEGEAGSGLMGTADYIAPEQTIDPHGVDTRADVYALGCTLYHLLMGRPPFPGMSLVRKLLDHRQTPPPPLRQARPDLPEALEGVVLRMLEKKPADRYQTPALAAVALAPFCRDDVPRLDLGKFRPPDDVTEAAPEEAPALPEPATTGRAKGPPGGVERRASPRRGGHLVPVLIADALADGEQLRGWVLDRSAGGLGLLVGEALEIGTIVRVRPDGPEAASRWVQVRVIYCNPERIRWRVGCQFVQKPAADVLCRFG